MPRQTATAALRFRGHIVRGQDKAPWPQASTANVVPAMGRAASSSLALQLPAHWLALAQLLLGPGHPSSTWLWSIQMWPGNRPPLTPIPGVHQPRPVQQPLTPPAQQTHTC